MNSLLPFVAAPDGEGTPWRRAAKAGASLRALGVGTALAAVVASRGIVVASEASAGPPKEAIPALAVSPGEGEVRALPPEEARRRLTALRTEIARHDALYHQKAAPEISDFDYDRLKERLRLLERVWPELAAEAEAAGMAIGDVGDDRTGLFQTYRHRERMLSLDKTYAEADLRAFHARLAKGVGRDDLDYVIEPKFDGLAVSVTFERGRLVRAVTRGNGIEGDDITANLALIRGLPRTLWTAPGVAPPDLIELRGEIYVTFAEFERINAEREAAGGAAFANPRNLAAGTIRQREPSETGGRVLDIVFYGVGACEPATAQPVSQRELHAAIRGWGLPGVTATWPARGGTELWAAVMALGRARPGFAFPTDGAVVKLDAVARQRELGTSESAPRWAIAYKFAPERVETQVKAITIQVGRTGVLTPVAELAPVRLAGSTVARATLHNRDELARRDVRPGDFVYVEKAGEIVPAIVGVNVARRPAGTAAFVFPAECPHCHTAVAQRPGEVAVRCPNPACPAQLQRRLEHFAAKECVDIDGLGGATIEALVQKGWVKSVPDLYRLDRAALLTLGKDVGRSADRLLAAIEASKRAELWRFVHGLGIPQVGAVAAREMARRLGSLEALAKATTVEAGVDVAGRAVVAYFSEARNRAAIDELIALGVRPAFAPEIVVTNGRLAGKTVVLTGTLSTLTRAQAVAKIVAVGGKVTETVSKNTHFVVAGAEPGAKLEQARKLGIAVIDEAGLLALITASE